MASLTLELLSVLFSESAGFAKSHLAGGNCGIAIRTGGNGGREQYVDRDFHPPYLYLGARPVVSSAPSSFQRGQKFELSSPDAATITNVVLARPMAVTHQRDTEQKTSEMPYVPIDFSIFGALDSSGAVTDPFGVGNE
jgi:hypothetical protein